MRPIVMFNARKILDSQLYATEIGELNLFLTAYIVSNCLVPGKIEQFVMIGDLNGISLADVPFQAMLGE